MTSNCSSSRSSVTITPSSSVDKTLSVFEVVRISWVSHFSVRVCRSSLSVDRYLLNRLQESCGMAHPFNRISTSPTHLPHIWGLGFSRLASALCLNLRCFGLVHSVSFDSVSEMTESTQSKHLRQNQL